jgi:hypothetical protein
MDDALFSSEFEPADTRYLWRLWLADLLDLATSALLGWGALRAVDLERTPRSLVVAGVVVWLLLSMTGGWSGWTPWRAVVRLRLVKDGGAPGPGLGLGRAFLVPLDLIVSPAVQRRYGDRFLKVQPETASLLSKRWRVGLGVQAFWLVMVFASVWFVVMPTKREALTYLRKLDGWRCCHAKTPPEPYTCSTSVSRAVDAAEDGDAQAQALVADCPRAAAEMGR